MLRLALYQPDIPQNTGALLRLAACLAVPVDIIEPCGFVFDDRRLRRSGMDYLEAVSLTRHSSWSTFLKAREENAGLKAREENAGLKAREENAGRLILLSTRAETPHTAFAFRPGDTLLLGRESAGVPEDVAAASESWLRIPVAAGLRSLNVALAAAIVLGEALRQLDAFPRNGQNAALHNNFP